MADCKVISHRGANLRAPQNTIPAFQKSLEIGVDGFETDVHMTADGVPVICHNYTIDETSNGTGEIASKTLEELRRYDFGSYFSDEFKRTKIPTLDEFLSLCETADIEIMNIELKTPLNGEKDIVSKTIAAVKEHSLFDKLLISSFSPELLVECKRVDAKCKTGFLYSPDRKICYQKMIFGYVKFAKEIKADYLHPHYSLVSKAYVKKLHEAGVGVNPWTVDKPKSVKKLLDCGVDGIITNAPDMVNSIVKIK
ncbi:MAG: glycerophosphodiester phosphodiesterase [Acutalibacteraceae bacterium]